MKTALITAVIVFAGALCAQTARAQAYSQPAFHSSDTLAPRDEWGFLHQMPAPNSTDLEWRYHWRPLYWLESGKDLANQPAYVAAVQRELRRFGYYCGEIDGIFTLDVSEAIERLQKNYSMRVTGTITPTVRRALHLP